MKKIKSPWYGLFWILVWTVALMVFLGSGRFDTRESWGLVIVWFVMVGITVYKLIEHVRVDAKKTAAPASPEKTAPALNAPCPCGSGKKYKRCCGVGKQ